MNGKNRNYIIHKVNYLILIAMSLFTSISLAQEQDTNPTEILAWKNLNVLNISELENYLKQYQNSINAPQAELALELQKTILSIKSGTTKSKLVIPFEALGDKWKKSKKLMPDAGVLGLSYKLINGQDAFGVFSPIQGREIEIRSGSTLYTNDDGYFLINPLKTKPLFPTGYGSIIAYKTGGASMHVALMSCWTQIDGESKLLVIHDAIGLFIAEGDVLEMDKLKPYIDSYFIETSGDSIVYFGVMDNIGLVYLKGNVTVTLPDGKKVYIE